MKAKEQKQLQLSDPNWEAVRPIYKKLSDEFHFLTGAYRLTLTPERKLMMDHLIIVIDGVDQYIDDLPTQQLRDEITGSILQFLSNPNEQWSNQTVEPAFRSLIEVIKSIVLQSNIRDRFSDAAQKIFQYTEEKRHTNDRKQLINLVILEGKATAELPLSIMGVDPDHSFGQFFTRLCMLMGVADLIVDARSDFKANYIALKPGIRLYFDLNRILITEGLKILWYFPKKLGFLWYVIRMSIALIRG